MARRDHLFVTGSPTRSKFKPVLPVIKGAPYARTDRKGHAKSLVKAMEKVREAAKKNVDKQDLVPEGDRGFYAVFESAKGTELPRNFFDSSRRGMDLLLLDKVQRDRQEATVFVRDAKVKRFSDDIKPYQNQSTNGKRKPPNADFFDKLESIRPAKLTDLWNDVVDLPDIDVTFDWELWIRPGTEDLIRDTAPELGIDVVRGSLRFPEAVVMRVVCKRSDLAKLMRRVPVISELRAASSFAAGLVDLTPQQQTAAANALLARLVHPPEDAPRVCVIDSGVRRSHPLLAPFIESQRCLTINSAWSATDHHGHGTAMAGVALYGDLSPLLSSTTPVQITHRLESVTALPPAVSGVDAPLAGDTIRQAVRIIERTSRDRRLFSISMSAPRERFDGIPSSLSTVIDQLAFGRRNKRRLMIVPAGNIEDVPIRLTDHIALNDASPMLSPAQAVNAVTVGACTHFSSSSMPADHVAPTGDLSPTSRTAIMWTGGMANKPDIVMEGGNLAVDIDGVSTIHKPELRVITTRMNFTSQRFACTGETSAATAAAANLAAAIAARYPEATPETVRGLLLHSARWTTAMRGRMPARPNRGEVSDLMKRFGFGMPTRDRALDSLDNELTMIIQSEITPYRLVGNGRSLGLNEMVWHNLPWPRQALELLGDTEVTLRVTLTYFSEPNPSSVTKGQAARYSSFKLAWFLKGAEESAAETISRVNTAERADDWAKSDLREEDRFLIGPRNNRRGTVHQDTWVGPASDLMLKDGIGVYPAKGWWGDKVAKAKRLRSIPYSLIVSIETPETELENSVYSEVLTEIQTQVPAEVPIAW